MEYPKEFVETVKEVFPTWERMHQALEAGSEMVGRYLSDSRGSIDPNRVIELIDGGQVQRLRDQAVRLNRISDLYAQWLNHARD